MVQPNDQRAKDGYAHKADPQRQLNVSNTVFVHLAALEHAAERGKQNLGLCKEPQHGCGEHHGYTPPQAPRIGQVRAPKDGIGHLIGAIGLRDLLKVLWQDLAIHNHQRRQHQVVGDHADHQTVGDAHAHQAAGAHHG